jgi:hypothetical protein
MNYQILLNCNKVHMAAPHLNMWLNFKMPRTTREKNARTKTSSKIATPGRDYFVLLVISIW